MSHNGSISRPIIEKLNKENYDAWSFEMMMVLVDRDLDDIVRGTETIDDSATAEQKALFKKKQRKAMALIGLHVGRDFLPYIMNIKDPKKLWDQLEDFYTEGAQAQRIQLRRQLERATMRKEEDLTQFASRLKGIINKLTAAGYVPSEDSQVCALLGGLSKEYSTVVEVLETQMQDLTFEAALRRLQTKESKLKDQEESEEANGRTEQAFHARESRKCFYCKRKGHIKKNCFKFKKDLKNGSARKNNEKAEVAFLASEPEEPRRSSRENEIGGGGPQEKGHVTLLAEELEEGSSNHFIIDSGATAHMTCQRSWLDDLKETAEPKSVAMGDGRKLAVKGIGNIRMKTNIKNYESVFMLKSVLYVPELAANLLSLSAATEHGVSVYFSKGACFLYSSNKELVAKGVKSSGLYKLLGDPRKSQGITHTLHVVQEANERIWHYRLGHLNKEDLWRLSNGMAHGMKIKGEMTKGQICEPCLYGKGHRLPVPKESTSKTTKILELVHTDICGPVSPVSVGGSQYVLTFIDDYSRASWVRFLKKKDETAEELKNWVRLVENQFDRKVKRIRSDNGGEYVNRTLKLYFKEKGIHHERTVAYTPSQNGVAERLNRTLFEKARSMVSQLPVVSKKLWAEAVATANYVRNRSPTAALGDKGAPFKVLTGKTPSIEHLRVFGAPAYVHIAKEKRKGKFSRQSFKGVMVGYAENAKGYRIYSNEGVQVHKDVIFNELEVVRVHKPFGDLHDAHEDSNEQDPLKEKEIAQGEDQAEERRYPARERKPTQFYEPGDENTEIAAVAYTEPISYEEAKAAPDKDLWQKAIQSELESLMKNSTWELCELPPGRRAISSKWVFQLKKNEKGEAVRHKARLVARGFSQTQGVDYDEVFAPVVKSTTVRTMLSFAASRNLEIIHLDVKTAFLNGELEEEVFMEIPEGYEIEEKGKICKLKKALYGLKQAPRMWNAKLNKELRKMNLKQSNADPSLYIKHKSSGRMFILVYVDDLLVFGENMKDIEEFIARFKKLFDMRNLGDAKYFLGIEITRDKENGTVKISQKQYIAKLLKRFKMEDCRKNKVSIQAGHNLSIKGCPSGEDKEKEMAAMPYANLIGGLLYLSNWTRPDISYAVGVLSKYMKNPGKEHWKVAKGVLRYLKGTMEKGIMYGGKSKQFEIYCDADYAGDIDTRRSTTGFAILYGNGAVSWASRLQPTVALSTTEAEYMAAADVCKELLWYRKLVVDLSIEEEMEKVVVLCDNQSCIKLTKNPVDHKRTKHIDIRYHFLRELEGKGTLQFDYCSSDNMIADFLTKAVPFYKQEVCADGMGLREEVNNTEWEC